MAFLPSRSPSIAGSCPPSTADFFRDLLRRFGERETREELGAYVPELLDLLLDAFPERR